MRDRIKVLHVEDEAGALDITKMFLRKMGHGNIEITPALSAEEGLERLEEGDYDVIISDYMMPGMDGIEFLEEVRRRGIKTPFIIFTGKGEERVAMEALNKGANRYIKKDRKPSELFEELARYIVELAEEKRREEENEKKLQALSGDGVNPFIIALSDEDWRLRKEAAEALGKLKDERAVQHLSEVLLNDKDADVRRAAAWALGEIGSPDAISALVRALDDEDRGVRESAVDALAKIGALDALLSALKSKKARVKSAAALALGRMGAEDAIPHLSEVLRNEKNPEVKWSAAWALAEIGRKSLRALISALNDEDECVRWCAVEALGKLKDERAVDHLIKLLNDDARNVRSGAAWALGEIGDKNAIEHLIKALGDRDAIVVENVMEALMRFPEDVVVDPLIKALGDGRVSANAAETLAKLCKKNENVIEILLNALKNAKDKKIRIGIAKVLSKTGDKRAENAIRSALEHENDEDVIKALEDALSHISHMSRRDPSPAYVRRLIEDVCGKIENSGQRRQMDERRPHIRQDAVRSLTPDQVRKLRKLYALGLNEEDIAKRLGVPKQAVSEFLSRERCDMIGKMLNIHRKKI